MPFCPSDSGSSDLRRFSQHDLRFHQVNLNSSRNNTNNRGGGGGGSDCSNNGSINSSTNRFAKKVFDLTSAISARVHPSSSSNNSSSSSHKSRGKLLKARSLEKDFESRLHVSQGAATTTNKAGNSQRTGRGDRRAPSAAASTTDPRLFDWCSKQESQRRTRSLERNHRYLVNLDSSGR
jgi:hypothetical protein